MLGVGVVFGSSLSIFSPFCLGMCLSHAYYMYITCAGVGVGSFQTAAPFSHSSVRVSQPFRFRVRVIQPFPP